MGTSHRGDCFSGEPGSSPGAESSRPLRWAWYVQARNGRSGHSSTSVSAFTLDLLVGVDNVATWLPPHPRTWRPCRI